MIIELEINGARVIISGDNLTVNVTEEAPQSQTPISHRRDLPTPVQIKALRKTLGESQAAFSKRFGVTQASVCRWERGYEKPSGPATLLLRGMLDEVSA